MKQKKAVVITAVGAGGKSSFLRGRALEYARSGMRAAVTTTTHIWKPDRAGCEDVSALDEAAPGVLVFRGTDGIDTIGIPREDGRLAAIPRDAFARICALYDAVLVEGDGSRCMPVKIPGPKEPVIPGETDEIAVVMGPQAVGRRLDIVCHRYERQRLERAGIIPAASGSISDECADEALTVTEEMLEKIADTFYVIPLRRQFPDARVFYAPGSYPLDRENPGDLRYNCSVTAVLMASGFGRRYGGNKLLDDLDGRPLYRHALDHIAQALGKDALIVVTQYDEIFHQVREMGIRAVLNDQAAEGISASIRLGTEHALRSYPAIAQTGRTEGAESASGSDPVLLFFAADMPYLSAEEIRRYVRQFLWSGKSFGCMEAGPDHIMTNPGAFRLGRVPSPLMEDAPAGGIAAAEYGDGEDRSRKCGRFMEPCVARQLLELHGDRGARRIMKRYPHDIYRYQVSEEAVTDIDVKNP